MSAKDQAILFGETVFTILLISFVIIYFIVGDRMDMIQKLMRIISPIAVFALLLLIKVKLDKYELKKRKIEQNVELVISFNFYQKIFTDFVIFFQPIVILILAVIYKGTIDMDDIMQSAAAFLIFYSWFRYLLGKQANG